MKKGKHFDDDRQAQYMVLRKELCKKYERFGPEELPKIAIDVDQTDFEKQKQNIKEAEKQIKTVYYVILENKTRIFDKSLVMLLQQAQEVVGELF